MKKLGLIGGLGPESTIQYYHDILYLVQSKMPDGSFPHLTIENVNVFTVLGLCGKQDYDALADYLSAAIDRVTAAGADFAALAANTPHIIFDELASRAKIPLLSIVDATCDAAVDLGVKKVALLGTAFTMEGSFFKDKLTAKSICPVTPAPAERAYIGDKIANELEHGIISETTRTAFLQILQRMIAEDGVEAVVLGCTELPLLFAGQTLPVKALDTMQLHIEAIAARMLEE